MPGILKRLARRALRPVAAALSAAAAAVLRRGLVPDDVAHDIFARAGFHLLRKSFYLPIPEADDLASEYWEGESAMVGVEVNEENALALLEGPVARYMGEFRETFPLRGEPDTGRFHLVNGSFMAIDAFEGRQMLPEHRMLVVDEGHELVDRVTSTITDEVTPGLTRETHDP